AQKERFRRLWRVVFAIDPTEHERLNREQLLEPLERAIILCVLRQAPASVSIEDAVRSLASELTSRKGSPLHGKTVIDEDQFAVAARSHPTMAYPGGAPSLLTCIRR